MCLGQFFLYGKYNNMEESGYIYSKVETIDI